MSCGPFSGRRRSGRNSRLNVAAHFLLVAVIVLWAILSSAPADALMLPNDCPAVLSGDLSLTVPVVYVNSQAFSLDFRVVPEQGGIELTGFAPTDAGAYPNCNPAFLSQDLVFHIPELQFSGGSYVADFDYAHDLVLTLSGAGSRANTDVYDLLPGSTFQQGCVPPCMCPVSVQLPMTGAFSLIEMDPDRPMEHKYSLDDINWTVAEAGGGVLHTITGFGVYRIGGDFALMQQLVLDLSINAGPMIHLDSGMHIPKDPFPGISISLDTGTQCFNTSLQIVTGPID